MALLRLLDARGYDFVTPTLATVRRWRSRSPPGAPDLRDILGWGMAFRAADLEPEVFAVLEATNLLVVADGLMRCSLRAARLHGRLFLHSASERSGEAAVFLGPDSYRFADFIQHEIGTAPVRTLMDVGTGAGVGAIVAGGWTTGARVMATDVNPRALRLTKANARHAGVSLEAWLADGLGEGPGDLDLVLANPPYVAGASATYKAGGGAHGEQLALDWAQAASTRLAVGGRFLLYTGAPILRGGRDAVLAGLERIVAGGRFALAYRELDPDVFGGELRRSAYKDVERIAAVGAVISRLG